MKGKSTKRILAMILSVCMILTMMPSMAFAGPIGEPDEPIVGVTEDIVEDPVQPISNLADNSVAPVAQEPATSAASFAELLGGDEYAKVADKTVTLQKDISVSETIAISGASSTEITLDLNGKNISGNLNTTLISITGGVKLEITDKSENAKGSIVNNYNTANFFSGTTGISISSGSELSVKGGVTISGLTNVLKASGDSKIAIDGATIKATKENGKALDGTPVNDPKGSKTYKYVTLLISDSVENTNHTKIIGNWGSSWSNASKIDGGYFTYFQINSKKPESGVGANESILGTGKGFVSVEDEYKNEFTYKVGDANEESEAYIILDGQGSNKVYGSVSDLVKFYGKTNKTIYIQKTAELTLGEFGDVVGGRYNDSNTLTFAEGDGVNDAIKLTINIASMKVGSIKYSGDHLSVNDSNIKAAEGYSKVTGEEKEIKYDIDKDNPNATIEVKVDDNTYTCGVDSLSSLIREIQGKTATIKLLKNVTYGQQIQLDGNTKLTLDLNGNTYTYNNENGAAFLVKGTESNAAELIITDTSNSNKGVLNCSKTDEAVSVGDFKNTKAANKLTINTGVTVKGSVTVLDKGILDLEGSIEANGFAISGNGSHDGTTITIKNGATVKSANSAAIYHPQEGTLTIGESVSEKPAPNITGLAGIVARDGKVEVKDGNITATGEGPLVVGDAKDAYGNPVSVPAAGLVYDKAEGYSEGSGTSVKVEKGVVHSDNGPSVVYTEAGEPAVNSKDDPKVEITAGTFTTGEGTKKKGDVNATQYVEQKPSEVDTVDPTSGEVKKVTEETPLAILQVGYGATAEEAYTKAAAFRPDWEGGKPAVQDWGEQTMWITFNKAIPEGTYYWLSVNDPAGKEYGILCKGDGKARTFAMSFKNEEMWELKPDDFGLTNAGSCTVDVYTKNITAETKETPKNVEPNLSGSAEISAAAGITNADIPVVGFQAMADAAQTEIAANIEKVFNKKDYKTPTDLGTNTMYVVVKANNQSKAPVTLSIEVKHGEEKYVEYAGASWEETQNGTAHN